MKFKRVVFWAHLSTAIAVSLFVLIMSVTGVLLTYERQMLAGAQQRNHVPEAAAGAAPLSADRLAQIARASAPAAGDATLIFSSDPTAPVTVSMGRQGAVLLNPYTGAVVEDAAAGLSRFFSLMTNWHRYLNTATRETGRAFIDASNLMFLFLVVSGIYIWLPDVWKWPAVKFRLLFDTSPLNSKMRDFNWHHVFSFWAVIPLLLIVFSGVVMSYGWANNLLFAAFGEQAPQRRGPPGEAAPAAGPSGRMAGAGDVVPAMPGASLDALLAAARGQASDWRTISVPLRISGESVSLTVERQTTAERAPRPTLKLKTADASVVSFSDPSGGAQPPQTPGQRARSWIRFVHTGEEYGVIGQTVAGLASLAACFLVYTGLALAYRRLIRPLFSHA